MKLLYITNVQIPAADAQSVQVESMCDAFAETLGNDFLLVSPNTKENAHSLKLFQWRRVNIVHWLPRSFRYLHLILSSIAIVLKFKPDLIYSRDIGVVCIYTLFGVRSVYEMHKPFETK